jgi:hypothetical protein
LSVIVPLKGPQLTFPPFAGYFLHFWTGEMVAVEFGADVGDFFDGELALRQTVLLLMLS